MAAPRPEGAADVFGGKVARGLRPTAKMPRGSAPSAVLALLAAACAAPAALAAAAANPPAAHARAQHLVAVRAAVPAPDCLADPTAAACADFRLPLSNTSASLDVLCGSMPNMPGCSLRKLCRSGRAGIANLWFCQEFSLLADVCAKDMPGMRGCGDYTKLCKAGSVVRQCYNEPAVSYLPTTRRAKQLVLDICADMYMTGCERCGATGMCPGFEVYSDLCLSMPEMEQCDEWKRMCKAEPLLPVCPPTGDSDGSPNSRGPTMKMFFHFGYSDYVLFDFWVPRTATSYALACLACFTLAVAYEWLLALGAHLEAQWNPLMPAGGAALAAGPGGLEGVDTILAAGGTPLSPLASTSSTYSDTPLLNRPQDGGPSRRKKGGGGSSATAAAPRSKLGSSHSRQHSHGAGALVADDSGADRDLEHGAMPDESLDAGDHAHLLAGSAASQAAGHGQRSGSPPPAHRAPSSLSSTSSTSSSTTVARMSFLSRGWWLAVWPSAFLFRFFTKPTWTPLEVRLGRTVLRIVTVSGAYLCMLVIMTFNVGLFLSIVFGLGFGTFLFSEEFGRGAPSAVQPRIEKEHCC
ncbi:hypothetical protein HK105_200879 [Polyrhizophydium stewartii]|uniref:Copper transporter n=1 Tax=Polyrhizophydium stewartii TaxID=2732419 RepID=A0ABR4NI83_9FUNG